MKKVVFLGGKQIGCDCLRCLCSHSDVVLVVSNEGEPGIHKIAIDNGIPYIAINDINTDEMAARIRVLSPDFIFVVYYDKILSPTIFNIPKEGSINLHLADSERYRGCYPTTYAIINGDAEYGVTIHYIDKGVDTGNIIARAVFGLDDDWTGEDLYYAASGEGYGLFERNIDSILSGDIGSVPQGLSGEYHKRSDFPSHEIDIDSTTLNRIRALIFPSFPAPYFRIGDKKYGIVEL